MPGVPDEEIITPPLLRRWPLPDPEGDTLARGGSAGRGGALRAGAGRLQLVVADESAVPLSIAVPEARVLGLPSGDGGPPDEVLKLTQDADVIAIGPGLDGIEQTAELMRAILGVAEVNSAVVVGAYALGALGKEAGLLRQRRAVLTPNVTEAGHLLGRDAGGDLAAAARELAGRYRAVVSLYGHIAVRTARRGVRRAGRGVGHLG